MTNYDSSDEYLKSVPAEEKKAENNFLKMLNQQFNVNDLIEKYGQGGYASSPNIPKEIPNIYEQQK